MNSRESKYYAEGLADGTILTLKTVLGIVEPPVTRQDQVWSGEIPDDLRKYLEDALGRAQKHQEEFIEEVQR